MARGLHGILDGQAETGERLGRLTDDIDAAFDERGLSGRARAHDRAANPS